MHRFALVLLMCNQAAADPSPVDARFVPAIRAAASHYQAWGRVDARPNIAPDLCRAPLPADYGSTGDIRLTATGDDSPHGKKLYYLYASGKEDYLDLRRAEAKLPIGFSIIKQSFAARPATKAEIAAIEPAPDPHHLYNPRTFTSEPRRGRGSVTVGDKVFVPGDARDLFVMTKVGAPGAAGTDAGWVYGTVAPDGKVTSAGRVESCMGCHDSATHERLFGLAE